MTARVNTLVNREKAYAQKISSGVMRVNYDQAQLSSKEQWMLSSEQKTTVEVPESETTREKKKI